MNERIKELAIKAGGGPSKWYTDPDVLQEFAELIVKECIQVSEPVLNEPYEDMSEFGKGLVEGQDVAIEKIKQHFGVEE